MRILICTFTYLPNRDGVAATAAALAGGLVARGHEVAVAAACRINSSRKPEFESGVEVRRFAVEGVSQEARNKENARLVSWLLEEQFDAIICKCWNMWPTNLVAGLGRQLRGIKILYSHGFTTHLVDWSPHFAWGVGRWVRELPYVFRLPWHLRDFDWVTFNTAMPDFRRFFDVLVAKLTRFRRFSIVANGAYPEKFPLSGISFRERYGIAEPAIFLCVANYSPRKNQALAVRAFRQARLADTALVFIGSELGEYGREVQVLDEELAAVQPLGRVVFLENVSQELIAAAYVACDAFVLSAKAETQPIVLLEAMAVGKPWISTDTGCVSELPGGIVASGEKAFVAALRRLASNPELRAQIGAEGKEGSRKKYTWDASIAAYDELLHRLVSGPVSSDTRDP